MAVTINKTDGTVLATIQDGALDTTSTNLSLIGRLYRNYGELVNENFIKILENFANSTSPTTPIIGQLWYNTTSGSLNVYRSTGFITLANLTSSSAQPSNAKAGDMWFDTADGQLKFYNGSAWLVISPQYTLNQTKTGIFIETIRDETNGNHICTVHYQQNSVVAIECRDAEWVPQIAISGFDSVKPGYNLADISGQKFRGTADNADYLGDLPANVYLRNDVNGTIDGSLKVNDDGFTVGNDDDVTIYVDGANAYISKADNDLYFMSGLSTVFIMKDTIQTAFAAGTQSSPTITFTNDLNTGIYRSGSGEMSFISDGDNMVQINNFGMNVSGTLTADAIEATITSLSVETSNILVSGTANVNNLVVTGNTTLGNHHLDQVTIRGGNVSIPNNLTWANGWVAFQGQVRINADLATTDNSQVYISTGAYIEGDTEIAGNLLLGSTNKLSFGTLDIQSSSGAITIETTKGAGYSQVGDVNLGRTNGLRSYNTPKAWISFNGTLGGLAINDSFNIDLVTRTSTYNYTFTMEHPFTSSAIAVVGTDGVRVGSYPSVGASSFSVTTSSENSKMALAIFYQ